jgi:large subunit ribosomal protein L17
MNHKKAGRKFGRNPSHRRAMFRNMAANLVLHERIETTDAKAKEMRRIAERLLSKAVRLGGDLTVDVSTLSDEEKVRVVTARLAAKRQVATFLPPYGTKVTADGESVRVDLVKKLFEEIAPRFAARVASADGKGGGYTRITKLVSRRGDNAPMAVLEWLPADA